MATKSTTSSIKQKPEKIKSKKIEISKGKGMKNSSKSKNSKHGKKSMRRSKNKNQNNKPPTTVRSTDGITFLESSSESEGYDDYDGHFDNPTESEDKDLKMAKVAVEKVPQLQNNKLEDNQDFIAFSASSSDEKDIQEKQALEVDEQVTKEPTKILKSDYPWIINHDHSKQKEISDWLTLEIADFVSYISPSREEIESRNQTISKVRNAVKQLWPDADLHVFGSYATDLYLPGSDIDCVINSKAGDKENRNSLYSLASFLKQQGLATQIEVIAKTRVPIIKFVEPESNIHIDVSFERTNGLEAAKLIREWLQDTPGLRELVLIIKQFLHSRRLNNVHTGGLGGFSIICIVFSFLQMHPRIITNEIDPMENLGVLLICLLYTSRCV